MHADSAGSRGLDALDFHAALVLVGAGLLVVVVDLVVGRLPGSSSPTFNAAVGFIVSLGAVGVLAWRLLSLPLSPWQAAGVALVALAVAVGLSRLGWIWPAVPFKVTAAVLLGTLLGRVMEAPSWLLMAAVVAFLADLWSVFAGPTKVVVEKAPVVLDYALVHFPMLGSTRPRRRSGHDRPALRGGVRLGESAGGPAAARIVLGHACVVRLDASLDDHPRAGAACAPTAGVGLPGDQRRPLLEAGQSREIRRA